jgi:hypothetical protein
MMQQVDEIALGLGGYLHPFAMGLGASAYWNWNRDGLTAIPTQTLRTFEQAFREACHACRKIHCNLDGIRDPILAADRGKTGGFAAGNLTNAELHALRTEPAWIAKTIFYRKGVPVRSPFP